MTGEREGIKELREEKKETRKKLIKGMRENERKRKKNKYRGGTLDATTSPSLIYHRLRQIDEFSFLKQL